MFTPPPSPLPPRTRMQPCTDDCQLDSDVLTQDNLISVNAKRIISRRMRWAVLIVPLVLVLITTMTHYVTHPVVFDVLSGSPNMDWVPSLTDWRPHKRHPFPQPQLATTSGSSIVFPTAVPSPSSSTPTATTSAVPQSVPTIPSAAPVLPTPFPQPFDSSLQNNFTTQGCENFFLNMTSTAAFRSCRPFSLLLQSSQAFLEEQSNLTALNTIVWGTCNTDLSQDTCSANMAWFASTLKSACSAELGEQNVMVVATLEGLQAFDLMRTAGCLPDQVTDSYCYVEAAHSTDPSDLYFYQLPNGIPLPNNTTPSCSSCTKSLMGLYVQALENTPKDTLADLQSTYARAQLLAVAQCGSGYAQSAVKTSGTAATARPSGRFFGSFTTISWTLMLISLML